MKGLGLGLLACVPLALGSPPVRAQEITSQLCGGGTIALTIPGRPLPPREECPMKACHAGTCRERFGQDKFDGDQGRRRN